MDGWRDGWVEGWMSDGRRDGEGEDWPPTQAKKIKSHLKPVTASQVLA